MPYSLSKVPTTPLVPDAETTPTNFNYAPNTRPTQSPHKGRRNTYMCYPTVSMTAKAGSDVVQSGRPIFDDFFQHLRPYIGNNTANVVFQMVKRLWFIRIDQ
ncbi:hypothetical protein TNCV_2212981 [Trichonephila clavipes]|nr:hypothetical protein TNCV_2212981 [Trichonephila clavipes]